MNLLQYTSEEMFSSTELIRKSKKVFDKLHNKDIEKAIILRDGKPAFMLLDFIEYEKLMHEYIRLKEEFSKKEKIDSNKSVIKKDELIGKELDEKDLEEALAQIDELDLDNLDENISETISTNKDVEVEALKEFWE